jgi:hypothetical protein
MKLRSPNYYKTMHQGIHDNLCNKLGLHKRNFSNSLIQEQLQQTPAAKGINPSPHEPTHHQDEKSSRIP